MSGQKLDDAAVVSGLRKVKWINVFSIEWRAAKSICIHTYISIYIYRHTHAYIYIYTGNKQHSKKACC
jgi:hypothetical protein